MGERRGWLVIDPLPRFRKDSRLGAPVLMDRWHPTPKGHRILSRELLEALSCHGELPDPALQLCAE
jgi:hypothetical protein